MVDKEKILKKLKTFTLIEYIVIAVVIYTLGILKFLEIIKTNFNRLLAYNIITTVFAVYLFFEFFWYLFSKKKRAKDDAIDRILPIPGAAYMLVFATICYINDAKGVIDYPFVKISVGAIMLYMATGSLTLGIYHFIKPGKQILEAVDEEYEKKLQEEEESKTKLEAPIEENKESSEN